MVKKQFNVRYNLEMQNGKTNVLPKQSRYYQSVIDAHELMPGEDFGALPPNYIIFICTNRLDSASISIYKVRKKTDSPRMAVKRQILA